MSNNVAVWSAANEVSIALNTMVSTYKTLRTIKKQESIILKERIRAFQTISKAKGKSLDNLGKEISCMNLQKQHNNFMDKYNGKRINVGIIGTGFIAKGLYYAISNSDHFQVPVIRSRRSPNSCLGFDTEIITNSNTKLIEESDIIVECSGDPVYATDIVKEALLSKKPVITMDAELQVTTGSYLSNLGTYFSEAEGDQPGCLAAMNREITQMGFRPIVYGNIKGFLNLYPEESEMRYWSKKQGLSIDQVTSFTDGTKVTIEQVLVANGLGADLAFGGMRGGQTVYDGFQEAALDMANYAAAHKIILSDYIMCKSKPTDGRRPPFPGVFIVAGHDDNQTSYLKYYKLGKGPFYILERPFHLCHLEILKTIYECLDDRKVLLNNGKAKYSVAAIAKRELKPGDIIRKGIGSFDVRGEAILRSQDTNHVPIGLLFNARVKKKIFPGQILHFDDIILPESEALNIWMNL